jgi:hypothetical protein
MKSVKCPSCGAPLDVEEGSVFMTCSFCGATAAPTQHFKTPRPAPQAPVQVIDLSSYRKGGKGVRATPARAAGCGLAVFLLIAGIGAFVFVRAQGIQRSVRESIAATQRGLSKATNTPTFGARREETAIPVARLAEPAFTGKHLLAASAPPTRFGTFEPVASLPWALSIAQVWSRDAKLERVDVDRVRPDGTLNVEDDPEAEVTYRFVSPSRFEALRERMNLEKNPRGDQEFWVEIESGKVYAYELQTLSQLASDDDAQEIAALTWPKSLPLTEIVPAIAKRKGVPAVPFFEGYLIRLEDEGWCWYISTLSGSPNIPRVRARDGRAWPY